MGNPPYDRHEAVTEDNKARTGGWVRWGDSGDGDDSIFRDFLDPVIYAGHGVHIKNIYNLYVYFWRWALWKVFEHPAAHGPGIVSFISASSYLDGEAFSGMREHMRRLCDDIWILDIGGEGRGTHKDDNIFAIQTPVAIAIAVRSEEVNQEIPARIHYIRIEGNREAKLAELDTIKEIANLKWQDCPNEWQASFRPSGKGNYFNWPLLTDLMPWQQSGCKVSRKWPIGSSVNILVHRWSVLLSASDTDRSDLFHESRDRKINRTYSDLFHPDCQLPSIISLDRNERIIQPVRYAYRSFDRQWIIPDNRVGDVFSVRLWRTHSDHQVYLTSLLTKRLGAGPALMACAAVPDLDHFSNRGAKDTIPLYRTTDSSVANFLPNLLELLGDAIKHKVNPENFLAYIYGILAQPAFTERFHKELETRELRIPITKNAKLFKKVCDIGAQLLWLHTYGVRFVPKNRRPGQIPPGTAKCLKALPGDKDGYPEDYYYDASTLTLHIGEGEFAPIACEVYEFEISGLKVVQSWVGYRMKEPKGRRSSQLDDINVDHWPAHFTTELLELLWILERTVAGYSEQAELLEDVLDSECFLETELPEVPDASRKPPKYSKKSGDLF